MPEGKLVAEFTVQDAFKVGETFTVTFKAHQVQEVLPAGTVFLLYACPPREPRPDDIKIVVMDSPDKVKDVHKMLSNLFGED